jgi:Lactonase, 7-bladed beta-propeller
MPDLHADLVLLQASRAPLHRVNRMGSRCSGFVWLFALASAFLISCGGQQSTGSSSNSGSTQSGQILYAINGATVTTYNVDAQASTITPIGTPVVLNSLQSFIQFIPSADDHFVYILWTDAQGKEQLSEYTTDASGVPKTPAAQVASVPTLMQFTPHPSGRFAYAMEVTGPSGSDSDSSGSLYTANVRLFSIEAHTGHFREDPTIIASYGPNYYLPASLFGLSADGKHLYIKYQGASGVAYRQRSVNTNSGSLGPEVGFYGQAGLWNETNTLAIGAQLIIDTYRSLGPVSTGYLNIVANPPAATALIHCTAAMLNACQSATNVQLHPSGQFLFLTDPEAQQVQIARINLPQRNIALTSSSIQMTAQTPGVFFSPDGTLVYALLASDGNLHVYSFDSHSGVLTDTGIFLTPPTPNAGFCPAQHS